jgi:hypothetical protein
VPVVAAVRAPPSHLPPGPPSRRRAPGLGIARLAAGYACGESSGEGRKRW